MKKKNVSDFVLLISLLLSQYLNIQEITKNLFKTSKINDSLAMQSFPEKREEITEENSSPKTSKKDQKDKKKPT